MMEMVRDRGSLNGVVQVPNLAANNLLQKFFIASNNHFCNRDSDEKHEEVEKKKKKKEEEGDEDIELTLGLSLNGQFGTDPRSRKRKNFELGRSSSIPEGFVFDEQRSGGSDMFQLDRTRSLPVETETKRNRSEKTRMFLDFQVPPPRKEKSSVVQADHGRKDGYSLNSVRDETEKPRTFLQFQAPLPTKKRCDVPTPVNGKGKNGNTTTTTKNKKSEVCGMEKARNILEDMPCVSTRDVGADGKRVEGFLYWYGGNKENVKIVCVCHGSFLSPAEFVRHGGVTVSDDGGDVNANPLRHIVVKLPSTSL